MRRSRFIRLVVLGAIVALAVWLDPTRVVWGLLRGEAFYKGRSTSYWARSIRPWTGWHLAIGESFGSSGLWHSRTITYQAVRHEWMDWLAERLCLPTTPWPAILDGDPAAAQVLTELIDHPEPIVRDWAEEGLARIGSEERGPTVSRSWHSGETPRRMPGDPKPDSEFDQVTKYRVHGGVGPGSY